MRLDLATLRRKGTASTPGTRFGGGGAVGYERPGNSLLHMFGMTKVAKERSECLTQAWTWV